jgi:hypothetical protein
MLMPHIGLASCFDLVREVTDGYYLWCPQGGKHSLKSVTMLIDSVRPKLTGELKLLTQDDLYSTNDARGFFLANKDSSFTIVHLEGQNRCWNRLVICKELFHVLMYSDGNRNIDISKHVVEFMASFPDLEKVPAPAVIAEWEAELAAMEFLFPYADRVVILKNPNYGSMEIARRYMVPRNMVERYLSEHYMKNLKPFFQ